MKSKKTVDKAKTVKKKTNKIKNEVSDLKAKIDLINKELNESQDKYIRLLAEFDNFKKRNEKNTLESYNKNLEKFILSFLPIADDVQRITDSDDKNNKAIMDAILIIQSKISKILNQYEAKFFNSLNEKFDPNLHEAIMTQESTKKSGLVIDEFEKGYKIKDKIIRHAKVIVSKGKK